MRGQETLPRPYEIVRPLPNGMVGRSYVVVNTETNKQAVCKIMSHQEMSDHQWEPATFKLFSRKLQSLNSPFFTPYFQVTEYKGSLYAFRDFITGENLEQHLKAKVADELDCNLQFALWKMIVRTVAHLHKNGVNLVGLRVRNIFITGDGSVTITDIYPMSSRLHFQMGVDTMSLGLLAPEIFSGDKVTPAADVWSLGVLLILMLTGKLPWKTENKFSMVKNIRSGVMDHRLIPTGAFGVISKALVIDPARRIGILSLLDRQPSKVEKLPKLMRLPISGVKPPSTAAFHDLVERNRLCLSGRTPCHAASQLSLKSLIIR